jgi:hypothetical protein
MRLTNTLTTTAVVAVLTISTIVVATTSSEAATVSHYSAARADWMKGAHAASAGHSHDWSAARTQLATYGKRDTHERSDLAVLIKATVTHTTAAQRAAVARATRELNGFFLTPGLYGVPQGHPAAYARADWIASAHVAAAVRNVQLGSALDEMYAFGKRYSAVREDLRSLESIPLTDTTAKQRATARRDAVTLDNFFHTPGLNY